MSLPAMRVIFFTVQPAVVVNTIISSFEQLGQKVLLVVTTPGPKARPTEAYKDIASETRRDVDVLVTNHIKRLPALLAGLEPDLIFVAGFPWRLPPELLSLPRLGCINTHPSLLPRYRGPNPLFWQVMNGETEGGLTMHRMDADFDTGPILVQRSFPIEPDDDVDSLYPKLLTQGATMIPEALALAAAGAPGTPQPADGSYAPLCGEAEQWLDWSRPAAYLRNQVRAWGQAGARAEIEGQKYRVYRARVVDLSPGLAKARQGMLLEHSNVGMLINTGDGGLLLEEAELKPGE
jgi:methionyl-tRNA formyltransferase